MSTNTFLESECCETALSACAHADDLDVDTTSAAMLTASSFPDTLTLSYSFGGLSADAPLVSRKITVDVRGATCAQDAFLQRTDAFVADVLEVFDASLCAFLASNSTDMHALNVCVSALHYIAHTALRTCPSILYVKLLARAAQLQPWVPQQALAPTLFIIEQTQTLLRAADDSPHCA